MESEKEKKQLHKKRHQMLHKFFDDLFADAVIHGKLNLDNKIFELINWSFKQTQNPDH